MPTPGRPGGAHAKASTRFLTDVSPPTSETWLDAGISMDQILAQETGKQTQLASLELAIESSETAGACDTGFACPYTNTISWKSQNTPLPTQNNPRVDLRAAVRRQRQHRSEGAARADPAAAQRARLGQRGDRAAAGRAAADAIAPSSPSISTRFATSSGASRSPRSKAIEELPLVDHPAGIPASWEEHVKLMFDLQVLAYQCDLTRVDHAHAGARAQRHDLSADRRARRASPDFAPPAGAGQGREGRQDQRLSREDVRRLSGEAAGDARRRRHAARSHDVDVRRGHGRQQQPLARSTFRSSSPAAAPARSRADGTSGSRTCRSRTCT